LGQKIDWMRANPNVCLEVEIIADRYHWTTVLVFGGYEEVQNTPEHAEVRRRAFELFEQRPEWWLPGAAKLARDEHHVPIVYRIRIQAISGRRVARDRAELDA
jgi:nitroimidazol reductase NimA-like FMN-containing flavoprotein (pyridoxamine 5'-phosphate oxidase superfamily)